MIPHERSLVKKYEAKPFSLVGVNSDGLEDLKKSLKDNPIPWRSFNNRQTGKAEISRQWNVSSWPTLYLIDHRGIIRKRWVGSPAADVLDREIDLLVEAALREK